MAIFVSCPHCGGNFHVKEKYAGRKGGCPSCGKSVAVPALPSTDTTLSKLEPSTEEPLPPRARALRPRKAAGSANFLEFTCSNCNKLMKAAIKWSGKRTQCTGCGAELKIPALTMGAIGGGKVSSPSDSTSDESSSETSSVSLSGYNRDLDLLLADTHVRKQAPAKVRGPSRRRAWSVSFGGSEFKVWLLLAGWGIVILSALAMFWSRDPLAGIGISLVVIVCTATVGVRLFQDGSQAMGVVCMLCSPFCGCFIALVAGWANSGRLRLGGVMPLLSVGVLINLGLNLAVGIENFKHDIEAAAEQVAAQQAVAPDGQPAANEDGRRLPGSVPLRTQLGDARVATLTIHSQVGELSFTKVCQRIRDVYPIQNYQGQRSGNLLTIDVGPIDNLEELLRRIDFGTVTVHDVGQRTATILVTDRSLVAEPAASEGGPSLDEDPSGNTIPVQSSPAPKSPPEAEPVEEIARLLAEAEDVHVFRRREALKQLSQIAWDENPARHPVAVKVGYRALADVDSDCRRAGFELLRSLEVEDEPLMDALRRALGDTSIFAQRDILRFLGEVGTPEAAEIVAQNFEIDRSVATDVLTQMGSMAESAVISALQNSDLFVRSAACEVLGKIGSEAALEPLAILYANDTLHVRNAAEKAGTAIQLRLRLQQGRSPRR